VDISAHEDDMDLLMLPLSLSLSLRHDILVLRFHTRCRRTDHPSTPIRRVHHHPTPPAAPSSHAPNLPCRTALDSWCIAF
jgi:hypothetical protein